MQYAMTKARGPQQNYDGQHSSPYPTDGSCRMYTILTAVIASIETRNESEVRYRESDSEYSFQSWPNSSWDPARDLWWTTKYASKKRWMNPAARIVL